MIELADSALQKEDERKAPDCYLLMEQNRQEQRKMRPIYNTIAVVILGGIILFVKTVCRKLKKPEGKIVIRSIKNYFEEASVFLSATSFFSRSASFSFPFLHCKSSMGQKFLQQEQCSLIFSIMRAS
ncbi:hypothetical protein DXA13_10100 [Clostridium sp. AM58-1XD]|nr:hypothetical protein DXA13_10100 [Clostridium sp. AM58-1XD]